MKKIIAVIFSLFIFSASGWCASQTFHGDITGNAATVTSGAYLNAANSFTLINPLITIAESWIGPSSTSGIYFKNAGVGLGVSPTVKLDVLGSIRAATLYFGDQSTTKPILITEATGVNGRRLSIESVSSTGSAEVQLVPGASVSGMASQIQWFNKTGTDYERFVISAVNNQFIIDSTKNNNGTVRNIYFVMGGSESPAVAGRNAAVIYSDASVDLQGGSFTGDSLNWGVTRTRIADMTNTGTSGLIIDTRTTTPASNVADTSYVEYRRGGARGYLVGLNSGGSNADSYDVYLSNVGTLASFYPNGDLRVTNLAGIGNRAVLSDTNGNLTNTVSDIRLKKNIETISDRIDVLASLDKLRGVYFNWNTDITEAKNLGSQKEMGMIADEVEKVIPELVGMNSTGYKSLDYAKVVGFLIEVAKAQQKQITALQKGN